MIRNSLIVAVLAFLVSLFINGAGWVGFFGPNISEEDGGPETEFVEESDTFEELAEVPEPPELPEPIQPDIPTTDVQVASDNPQDTLTPDSGTDVIEAEPAGEVSEEDPSPSAPAEQAEAPEGTPDAPEEEQAEVAEEAPSELLEEPIQPDTPEIALVPSPELPEIEAVEEEPVLETAVTRSLRPPAERPSETQRGEQDSTSEEPTEPAVASQAQRSGLDILADAGNNVLVGRNPITDARSTGNSTTTNYAGTVFQLLNERKERLYEDEKGSAIVQFQIAPDGSIAWVRVLRSSGTAGIERAAIAGVRSAGPFPPPPGREPVTLSFTFQST